MYTMKPYVCTVHLNHVMLPKAVWVYYKNYLHEMNIFHVTYVIEANINNHLSISCNIFVIIMEYLTVNHSQVIVVVIGRPVCIIASIASLHLRYKIYTYVLYLKLSPIHASTLMWWKTTCSSTYLGTQPSLISIIASYKQTSKSLL